MTRSLAPALAALLLISFASAGLAHEGVLHKGCPTGQSFTAGAITVTGAYARATPPAAQSAGGYLSITNSGDTGDVLVSAATPAAADTMLHSTTMNGQVMQMAPMQNGLEIPAHGSAALDPMHAHLMMTGMSEPLVEGQCFAMVLHFAKAGDLPIQLNIGSFGQSGPVLAEPAPPTSSQTDMNGMSMDDMSSMPGM